MTNDLVQNYSHLWKSNMTLTWNQDYGKLWLFSNDLDLVLELHSYLEAKP